MTDLRRQRRDGQRGFALLLIFAFAAIAAIGIYLELPRAVFESARAKEELLVERGQQYQLAIRRYYVKNKTYPQSLEALEETAGLRYLRRRYKDPMTGEEDWRLIHIGPAGYTDSKVHKPVDPTAEQKEVRSSSISEGYQVGQQVSAGGDKGIQGVAMRRRPGDHLTPGAELATEPPPDPNAAPVDPNAPPPGELDAAGNPPEEAPAEGEAENANDPNAPPPPPPTPGGESFVPNPANPPVPGAQPGTPVPGITSNPLFGVSPVSNPGGGPQPPNPANPAIRAINNLLTNPRQSGPGTPGAAVPTGGAPNPVLGAANQQAGGFTGGIAGVASKYEGEGIKLINERSKIDEWEFLFDYRQMQQNAAGAQAAGGVPGQQSAAPGSPGAFGGGSQAPGSGPRPGGNPSSGQSGGQSGGGGIFGGNATGGIFGGGGSATPTPKPTPAPAPPKRPRP